MRFGTLPLVLALVTGGAAASAQQPASSQAAPASSARVVGSVTAINGRILTVKPDSGAPVTFMVSDSARILETQPGAKTLAGATPVPLSGIAVGDRVLAMLHPSADGSAQTATTLIAMKQSSIAEHQQAEAADWQRRGAGGLVKSVDPAAGTVIVASGARTLTIHATSTTVVRRYSPDSISFSDTRPSTLAQIQPGDQLRARGDRTADGSEITADEIVAGSFRNIAGTVVSTDPGSGTLVVKDLATKAPVTIHVTPESQMHRLPAEMAQFLSARLKRSKPGQTEESGPESENHAASGQSGGGRRGGDLSQMLQRTPAVQLSDLHKGDAVMIVATQGTPGSATAVTLLAGVEPILTASPSASQSMFSASWNVGGGASAGGDEGTQ